MNIKNNPKPWQIAVLIMLSSALCLLLVIIEEHLWYTIGGGFPSLAVSAAIVAVAVAFCVWFDRKIRREECVSIVYLDVFKGCWGISVAVFIFLAADYSIGQYHYLRGLKERQAKRLAVESGEKTHKKDSVTVLSYQQIQEIFGKTVVTGNEYVGNLYHLLDHDHNLSEVEAMCIELPILDNMFANEIFLDVDSGVVVNDFVRAFKERYDKRIFMDYCRSLYDIRLKLDYPPYILENPLGKVVNPSGRTLAKAFPDKALRSIASDILMALYNVDNIEQLHERLKILVGKFNSKKCKYQLDLSIDQTSTGYNAEYISHVEALKYASVDQQEDPVREIISHLINTIEFDKKCIYALALSSVDERNGIDILGALMESGEYSQYLYDVWENWRDLVQYLYFGYDVTSSSFPDAYYFKVRNICANTILRHIQEHPEDKDSIINLCRFANAELYGGFNCCDDDLFCSNLSGRELFR